MATAERRAPTERSGHREHSEHSERLERSERTASVFPGFDAIAPDAERIIQALVRRRRELGVSQTAVAARMGTSQSAVARLEAGRSDARLSTLERYAAAVDASLSYGLSTRAEGPEPGGAARDRGGAT